MHACAFKGTSDKHYFGKHLVCDRGLVALTFPETFESEPHSHYGDFNVFCRLASEGWNFYDVEHPMTLAQRQTNPPSSASHC